MEEIKLIPARELETGIGGIDWDKLAAQQGLHRSGEDCKFRWQNYQSPLLNMGPFTKEEDIELIKLAKKYKESNWEQIAVDLQACTPLFLYCDWFRLVEDHTSASFVGKEA